MGLEFGFGIISRMLIGISIPIIIIFLICYGIYRAVHNRNTNIMDANGVPQARMSAKDFFIQVATFAALYTSVVTFLMLVYAYADKLFPDVLERGYYYRSYSYESLRWPMAILIVIFPIFLWLMRSMGKDFAQDPSKKEIGIHKFLVYLTLFASIASVICSLIAVIYKFLGGDVTGRFFVKALALIVTGLCVFLYYRWYHRSNPVQASAYGMTAAFVSSFVVLATFIAAFFILGTPADQRTIKFDERRAQDLRSLESTVEQYAYRNNVLPATLAAAEDNVTYKDPRTNQPYEYRVTGTTTFELCAVFEKATDENSSYGYRDTSDIYFKHGAGRTCFQRTATLGPKNTPEPYKPLY